MKFDISSLNSVKRRSLEETSDSRPKKRPPTRKIEKDELLQNFPLFAQIAAPNRFSILNINYNKFHDNHIISIKNQNQNSNSSVRTKSIPKSRPDFVKQNLRDILSSKILDQKKQTDFFKTALDKKRSTVTSTDKTTQMPRASSQKSSLFKLSSDKTRTSGFQFLGGKNDTKSKKSLVSVKDKLSGIFDKQHKGGLANFRHLRAEKSLPSNIGRAFDKEESYSMVDPHLLSAAVLFKKRFSKFLKTSANEIRQSEGTQDAVRWEGGLGGGE